MARLALPIAGIGRMESAGMNTQITLADSGGRMWITAPYDLSCAICAFMNHLEGC